MDLNHQNNMYSCNESSKDYCVPSLKVKSNCKNYDICEAFDFGSALQNVYPLLGLIFKYLPYADLVSASTVNDTWKKYACEEQEKRKKLSWFSFRKSVQPHEPVAEKSNINFSYNEISFGLVFYDFRSIEKEKQLCVHGPSSADKMSFIEYLKKEVMPKDKEFWVLASSKVYSIQKPWNQLTSVFNCLLIPTISNISIRVCHFSNSRTVKKLLPSVLPAEESVQCMIIFTSLNQRKLVRDFTLQIMERGNVSAALCGGVLLRRLNVCNDQLKSKMHCILFTLKVDTSAEFDAFSMVIEEEDVFETKVSEFRQKTILRQNSFIIRSCCEGKRCNDNETIVVQKYFPHTCVFGFDVGGEIGWDKLLREDCDDTGSASKKRKLPWKTCHEYTTVLALVTWGPVAK